MTDEELWSMTLGDPVIVTGGDYVYTGHLVSVFSKLDGLAVRCVVQDDTKRLFIHNPSQISKCESHR